jgi:hypothetical protein
MSHPPRRPPHDQYPLFALRQPICAFTHAVCISALALLFGAGVPSALACCEGVLFEEQIENKIDDRAVQFTSRMWIRWERYKCERDAYFPGSKPDVAAPAIDCKSDLQALKDQIRGTDPPKPPVVIVPFISAPTLLYDPVALACLGCLIILVRPIESHVMPTGRKRIVLLGLFLFLVRDWPQFLRNFAWHTVGEGRTIIAYPNYDVGRCSFIYQELVAFLWALLLSILWCQWEAQLNRQHAINDGRHADSLDMVLDFGRIEGLTHAYVHWQIASLVLSIPFFLATWFYWPLILQDRDFRYVPSAVAIHLLWAASWAFISLPLAVDWHDWSLRRSAAIAKLASDPNSANQLSALKELQPVSLVNLVGTGIGAVAGFLFPLLTALRP